LAKLWQEVFTSKTNKPVIVEAVHAGLECGKLASFFPNAEVISVGPEVKHLHSTNEKVRVSSVAEFYSVLVSLLSKI
jgi:dipeptidase D